MAAINAELPHRRTVMAAILKTNHPINNRYAGLSVSSQ